MPEHKKKEFEARLYFEVTMGMFANLKLYYIANTFVKALSKSADTLGKMLLSKEECDKVQEDCAFIWEDILWVVKTLPNGFIRIMRIKKEGALFTLINFKMEGDNRIVTYDSTAKPESERSMVGIYYLLMLLKKYGQAEIEVLPKNKKVRSQLLNDKSINETDMEVQVLDSRWFTTICRDEGFLVSGHFRLQPCKDENGEWTKRLIYINPYAKHGYHRLAPVVNLNGEDG